jgi:Fur family transcriptional regulator, zinc uptake regulator
MRQETLRLTAPRQRVLSVLKTAAKPVKPYEILRLMEQTGSLAHPPTIYRALDFLAGAGLAHKVASSGAYVACDHAAHGAFALLLVCQSCGVVSECDGGSIGVALYDKTAATGFRPEMDAMEILGHCRACL